MNMSKHELKALAKQKPRYKQFVQQLTFVQQFAEPSECRRLILMRYFDDTIATEQKGSSNRRCCDYCDDPNAINQVILRYKSKRENNMNVNNMVVRRGANNNQRAVDTEFMSLNEHTDNVITVC
eukprot:232699_1